MKKIVLKLDLHDDKDKQKAMKVVSTIQGIDSIAMDTKEMKMTVIGAVDPVSVVSKLRNKSFTTTHIVSVGPAKEEKKEEKKEEPKKEEPKKEEPKKVEPKEEPKKEDEEKKKKEAHEQFIQELVNSYKAYNPHMTTHYYVPSVEENPNSCSIL